MLLKLFPHQNDEMKEKTNCNIKSLVDNWHFKIKAKNFAKMKHFFWGHLKVWSTLPNFLPWHIEHWSMYPCYPVYRGPTFWLVWSSRWPNPHLTDVMETKVHNRQDTDPDLASKLTMFRKSILNNSSYSPNTVLICFEPTK